jgi:hypothetical protein
MRCNSSGSGSQEAIKHKLEIEPPGSSSNAKTEHAGRIALDPALRHGQLDNGES